MYRVYHKLANVAYIGANISPTKEHSGATMDFNGERGYSEVRNKQPLPKHYCLKKRAKPNIGSDRVIYISSGKDINFETGLV